MVNVYPKSLVCLVQSCRRHQVNFLSVAVPLGEEKKTREKDTNGKHFVEIEAKQQAKNQEEDDALSISSNLLGRKNRVAQESLFHGFWFCAVRLCT